MSKTGVIGGSGIYNIDGIKDLKNIRMKTPFGDPSDEFTTGSLEGREVVFLPRHGKGHRILPTELNYRANIYGMKKLGVERIISLTAVGSLKKELKPLDMLVVNQFVDRTNQARWTTFFGKGIVAHIAFAEPVCPDLSKVLYESGKAEGATIHRKGTYINMEGPAFSTLAESQLYRKWGMDVIGMTNMAEARLAREAEICYSTLAMITDYDCLHEEEEGESVSVDMIIANLNRNAGNAKKILKAVLRKLDDHRSCACKDALKFAIITAKENIPAETKAKLDIIIGKYI